MQAKLLVPCAKIICVLPPPKPVISILGVNISPVCNKTKFYIRCYWCNKTKFYIRCYWCYYWCYYKKSTGQNYCIRITNINIDGGLHQTLGIYLSSNWKENYGQYELIHQGYQLAIKNLKSS